MPASPLDGVLFFPVTPFTETGEVDLTALAEHVGRGIDAGPGGVFIACGTGGSRPPGGAGRGPGGRSGGPAGPTRGPSGPLRSSKSGKRAA